MSLILDTHHLSLKKANMKNSITILLLILSWPCFSQDITVSDPVPFRSDDTYDFIGKIKNQYLIFHNKGTEFEVKAFDKDLYATWDKEIELEKRRSTILGIVPSKDDFSVIYTYRKKRRLNLVLSRFSPTANLLDTATIKVYSNVLTPSFKIIRSEDKTKLLIYYTKEQKKLEVLVYDLETMKVLWERKIQPSDMAYYEKYEQFVLSTDGELFIILQKENRKLQREKHHYEIHQVTADNRYHFFSIPMQSHLTYDILFSFDNKNKRLVAAGLYSEKNRGRANGYFFMNIPSNNPGNHALIFEAFDKQVVDKLLGKKADVEKGIADLDVQEIVHRLDGGILMILERNRILERGGIGPGGANFNNRSIIDYYFDDVIVFSIHPDGKTHWKNVLHKKQYSQGDFAAYSSYFLLKTSASLRFIFNDEIKSENTVSEYVVKGSGEFERNSILSTDDQRIQLRFSEALQVGVSEFVVPSISRSKMKLIRVTF
jgi:hypothetical protein